MDILIQDLLPLVGSSFTVDTSAGQLQLMLIEASERPRRGLPAQFRTPLSLVFTGPADVQLNQDNYRLMHPLLKEVIWMLVPVSPFAAPNPDRLPLYEVILA
ncbi:MAG TPA: hypothetical protein VMH83_05345 [Candidatus Acidoferrum sp.]|nr:hypothetical protein [Candidatus Acidoferrum sp.]